MDIYKNSSIKNTSNLRKYDANANEFNKYFVKYGDILFTASSETPSEIAISSVYLLHDKAIFNGFSKKFSYNQQILLPKYAQFLFRSGHFRSKVVKYATGYTRFNISQTDLSNITIEIPSALIQQQIIDIKEHISYIITIKISCFIIYIKREEKRGVLMAIYKLKNICRVSDGEHGNVAFVESGIPFIRVKDFEDLPLTDKFISDLEFNRINKRTDIKINDILLSSVGTIGNIKINKWEKLGLARSIITIRSTEEKIALTKFIYYTLLCKIKVIQNLAKGSAQKVLSLKDIREFEIQLPHIKTQQQIIDIIEPKEKLFLSHSNCVRIDTIDNVKKDMQNLIDIIEPLENLEVKLVKHIEVVKSVFNNYISHLARNVKVSEISEIKKYSKLIKSENLKQNDLYYYSTGKTLSKNKMINISNFNRGISIPYEGAGMEFNGKFLPMLHDEPVYIARKWGIESKYIFSIYYSLLLEPSYKATTSGVKMPTLNMEVLADIKIFNNYQNIEKTLEKCYYAFNSISSIIENLRNIKEKMIQTLIK